MPRINLKTLPLYTRLCFIVLAVFMLSLVQSCYSFRSASLDPTLQSFYVGDFDLTALNAPVTINQTFAESLKDKISRESRLQFTDEDPHIEFNGSIQGFNVTSVAPLPDERTSFNRLTINVNIEYVNHLNPKDTWTRTFTHFEDFDANENLQSRQDELITIIFNQILEDIFNHAFNNW